MCLVALFFRMVDDAAVVVGANREEFFARGGEPPQRLDETGHIVGGRDPPHRDGRPVNSFGNRHSRPIRQRPLYALRRRAALTSARIQALRSCSS